MADLHALRTTLGTRLARHGAKPQVARQIMRHSDYKTTLKHYTVLGLDDTVGAINQLPAIGAPEPAKATGTMDVSPNPQQYPQQSGHDSVRNGAKRCDDDRGRSPPPQAPQMPVNAGTCDSVRDDAIMCDGNRGCNSAVECQLPKLDVVGSNPITRFFVSSSLLRASDHFCFRVVKGCRAFENSFENKRDDPRGRRASLARVIWSSTTSNGRSQYGAGPRMFAI